jgi:hypothetical protein
MCFFLRKERADLFARGAVDALVSNLFFPLRQMQVFLQERGKETAL